MGAKVAAIARHRSFFFNHINDVMISHFAANNGHQMRVNALSRQRGWGSCWKTLIWIEVRDVSRVFFSPPLTRSLWNSNLAMTNRVITFEIDLVRFELQRLNPPHLAWVNPSQWYKGEANMRKWRVWRNKSTAQPAFGHKFLLQRLEWEDAEVASPVEVIDSRGNLTSPLDPLTPPSLSSLIATTTPTASRRYCAFL